MIPDEAATTKSGQFFPNQNFENEALFGMCGSGMYADCVEKGAARSDTFHGIQCCGLIAQ